MPFLMPSTGSHVKCDANVKFLTPASKYLTSTSLPLWRRGLNIWLTFTTLHHHKVHCHQGTSHTQSTFGSLSETSRGTPGASSPSTLDLPLSDASPEPFAHRHRHTKRFRSRTPPGQLLWDCVDQTWCAHKRALQERGFSQR